MKGDIEGLILLLGVPARLQLKLWSARGASHHPLIWATIIHVSARFSARMVESFSADFLPAIESYWTESHLEFCQTSTTELLCEKMCSLFRRLG